MATMKHGIQGVMAFAATLLWINTEVALAATIYLKSGEKIEAKNIVISNDQLGIEISGQKLKWQLDEVSAVVFQTNFSLPDNATSGDRYGLGARDALRALRSLNSAIDSGNLRREDFSARIVDTKIKIDEFMHEYKEKPNPEFSEYLSNAIGYYGAASNAWNAEITKNFGSVAMNPYVNKCDGWIKKVAKEKWDTEGVDILGLNTTYYGVPYLIACAAEQIELAQSAFDDPRDVSKGATQHASVPTGLTPVAKAMVAVNKPFVPTTPLEKDTQEIALKLLKIRKFVDSGVVNNKINCEQYIKIVLCEQPMIQNYINKYSKENNLAVTRVKDVLDMYVFYANADECKDTATPNPIIEQFVMLKGHTEAIFIEPEKYLK